MVEVGGLEAGPVGDDASALQRAAHEHGDRAGAVVGAVVAVDARGAAELGDDRNHGLAPGLAHGLLDGGNGDVEHAQQARQLSVRSAFVDMRVPAHDARGADARAIGLRQVARG